MKTNDPPPRQQKIPPLGEKYIFWTGCAANYDARIATVVKATTKVLRTAGIELAFLGEEEACTGDCARRLGEEGLFQQLANQNIEMLERRGVTHIVTHCAHCFHALKNEYPRFGGSFEVYHHSELIAQLLRENRLQLKTTTRPVATLHDSCYVGRYNGIFDAPREILQAVCGPNTVEMPLHGEQSFCCGAGGACYWYDAPKREPAGTIRIREAVKAGARTVVAECPFCIKMLELGAQTAAGNTELKVQDISEIVADALCGEPDVVAPHAGDEQQRDEQEKAHA